MVVLFENVKQREGSGGGGHTAKSPAGLKPVTLQLCGMCPKHSLSKEL